LAYLEFEHVRKIFETGGTTLEAIADVSFDLEENSFTSIVGRSGCGKSTLLRLAAGILDKTFGSIRLRGKEVQGPRLDVGMVFQFPVLLKWRRIMQNILLPLELVDQDPNKYRDQALQLIELAGLKGFENKYPFELSGGMQQRACICRALINSPQLLLMDEPFGSLDAITREQLNFELLNIWNEKKNTVVFVTHSIEEAVLLSDTIVLLTPRPARVANTFQIDLPRARDLRTKYSQKFGDYVLAIHKELEEMPEKQTGS
jgi:NitT/TauT family transport system ATP-binding protein